MAGLRRMRRRYRGIPVVVVLLAALAFGLTSSSADTADPATAPIANDVSSGLQSFAQSLTGLDSLNQLGQSLPFTSQVPTAANGLNYAQTFTDSLKAKLAAHPAFTSLTELEAYLSTGISDTYGGVAVTANATVSPQTAGAPLYTVALQLHLSRTGTTPLKLDTSQVNVDGGSLATSFDATANLSFKYDPAQAAGNKFYLDAASAPLLSDDRERAGELHRDPVRHQPRVHERARRRQRRCRRHDQGAAPGPGRQRQDQSDRVDDDGAAAGVRRVVHRVARGRERQPLE